MDCALLIGPEDGPKLKKEARSTRVFHKKSPKQMASQKGSCKPQVKKSQIMIKHHSNKVAMISQSQKMPS